MRWNLLPPEPWFFDAFKRMTVELNRGALLLVELFTKNPVDPSLVDRISDVENVCDRLIHEVVQRLRATFVTPVDREDIHQFATALDNIMDAIDDASQRVPLHHIEHIRGGASDLARIIVSQTEQLTLAAERLPTGKGVVECVREINRLEKEADSIHRDAVGLLFDDERDALELIKWTDIFDFLEDAADRSDDAAGVLEGIIIKQG